MPTHEYNPAADRILPTFNQCACGKNKRAYWRTCWDCGCSCDPKGQALHDRECAFHGSYE